MSYQATVSTTQKYEDSQGEHIVTPAKLVLIEGEKYQSIVKTEEGLRLITKVSEVSNGLDWVKPILISETEEIEEGDWFYTKWYRGEYGGYVFKEGEKVYAQQFLNPHKILAFPKHFSDKHLQAIVDGKIEDGDGVLVKCEVLREPTDDGHAEKYKTQQIHLDQQSHITLFPAKQSLEEASEAYEDEWYDRVSLSQAFEDGAEWAKKNNY